MKEAIKASARRGLDSHRWRGGEYYSKGRVMKYFPDHPNANKKHVLRSRLVMEQHLGRYLTSEELVHHINEIIDDDRIENLQVVSPKQHAEIHVELRAARIDGTIEAKV